jgi:hypothetical protein
MTDAHLLATIATVVSSLLFSTTVFAAGWYCGRRRTQRSVKAEIDRFNWLMDQKIKAELQVLGR